MDPVIARNGNFYFGKYCSYYFITKFARLFFHESDFY